ncbi:MAG TPA: hypothetical protein VFA45_00135 [Actinomycetes bacterium]|nr:hypothetical protein [Actinomycetes bacterium]
MAVLVLARPHFIRDVDQAERLLHTITAANPRAASFIPSSDRMANDRVGAGGGTVTHTSPPTVRTG